MLSTNREPEIGEPPRRSKVALSDKFYFWMDAGFVCKHSACEFVDKRGGPPTRFIATNKSTLSRHHHRPEEHPCCSGESKCAAFHRLNKQVLVPRKRGRCAEGPSVCRHQGCSRQFTDNNRRTTHEATRHACEEDCTHCARHRDAVERRQEAQQAMQRSLELEEIRQTEARWAAVNRVTAAHHIMPDLQSGVGVSANADGSVNVMRLQEVSVHAAQQMLELCEWLVGNCLNAGEVIGRLKKNSAVIQSLLACDDLTTALNLLRENPQFAQEVMSMREFDLVALRLPIPSLDACLLMKDMLSISDHGWKVVVDVLKLPSSLGVSKLVNYRRSKMDGMLPLSTNNLRGYTMEIRKMLLAAIRLEKIPADADIQVKFSMDAGTIVKGAKEQAELFQMDIIKYTGAEKSTSSCKSNKNSYLISLFLPPLGARNPETNSHLKSQLAESISFINELVAQPRLQLEEDVFCNIEVLLCVDMKCLCEIYGLNSVWHSKATFGCCWCDVTRDQFGDLDIHEWPFRDVEKMKQMYDGAAHLSFSSRRAKAPKHQGVCNEPLFLVPLQNVIPCNLHMAMSLVKLLRKELVSMISTNEAALAIFERQLKAIGVKIYTPEEGKTMTLEERIKKSRFRRPASLAMLSRQDEILECLAPLNEHFANKVRDTKLLWRQAHVLLSIASSPTFALTAAEWKGYARLFGQKFLALYQKSHMTSYLHCFIYHYGEFLERFGGIEKLGGYSIETNVKWVKDNYASSSNHGGGRHAREDASLSQLLSKHFRMQPAFKAALPTESQRSWARSVNSGRTLSEAFPPDTQLRSRTGEGAIESSPNDSESPTRTEPRETPSPDRTSA